MKKTDGQEIDGGNKLKFDVLGLSQDAGEFTEANSIYNIYKQEQLKYIEEESIPQSVKNIVQEYFLEKEQ